jgi:hypothetical protein
LAAVLIDRRVTVGWGRWEFLVVAGVAELMVRAFVARQGTAPPARSGYSGG